MYTPVGMHMRKTTKWGNQSQMTYVNSLQHKMQSFRNYGHGCQWEYVTTLINWLIPKSPTFVHEFIRTYMFIAVSMNCDKII